MVNDDPYPRWWASRRRMRTQAEWKVDTHIFWATGPTSADTRRFISSAALLVKVMARIWKGETPCSRMSQAMRWVSTRVLPEPAPATTSNGPPGWVTASRWTGLRPARRSGLGLVVGLISGSPPMMAARRLLPLDGARRLGGDVQHD